MSLSHHVDLFTAYSSKHLNGDHTHDYHIQLKIDHSLRVLENAKKIIAGEGITGHAADLGLLAALYHDVGRFQQFTKYGTYKDADSVNHGRLGVLVLRSLELPRDIPEKDWRLIRAAVGQHNVKALNPKLPPLLTTVTQVVRDADKIDIYPLLLHHLEGTTDEKKVVIHHLDDTPDMYSKEVLDTVMANQICSYDILKYTNDFLILITSWLFTLNYRTSIPLFATDDHVHRAFSILPKTSGIQALEDKVNTFIHYNNHVAP